MHVDALLAHRVLNHELCPQNGCLTMSKQQNQDRNKMAIELMWNCPLKRMSRQWEKMVINHRIWGALFFGAM